MESNSPSGNKTLPQLQSEANPDQHCPVCGAALLHEKCKVVCRSPKCVYRIVFNCAEF